MNLMQPLLRALKKSRYRLSRQTSGYDWRDPWPMLIIPSHPPPLELNATNENPTVSSRKHYPLSWI